METDQNLQNKKFSGFLGAVLLVIGSYGSGHGCQNMASSVHYYPDAYSGWNAVASYGSYLTTLSTILFFVITYFALVSKSRAKG